MSRLWASSWSTLACQEVSVLARVQKNISVAVETIGLNLGFTYIRQLQNFDTVYRNPSWDNTLEQLLFLVRGDPWSAETSHTLFDLTHCLLRKWLEWWYDVNRGSWLSKTCWRKDRVVTAKLPDIRHVLVASSCAENPKVATE